MTTEDLSRFIAETKYADIPKEAIGIAKKAVLDFLGVAIAGSNEPAAGILSRHVKEMGAVGKARVFGGKYRTSPELAAWVNGAAGHALDFDDTDSVAAGFNMHPSVPILPAVFALGEEFDLSGKELLAAYIAGFEVEARVGAAMGAGSSEAGWHPTSVVGTIAAAAASASALKLNANEIQMALGVACSLASGSVRNFGTMTKPLHAGNAARNGVVAALLSKRGFTADPDILNGDFGFCSLYTAGQVRCMAEEPMAHGEWKILTVGLAFKPYPSCRDTHGCVDAVLYLRNRFNITPDQVDDVVCCVNPNQARNLGFTCPQTGNESKFSMQYCVGAALARGRLAMEDFRDSIVVEPAVRALLPRISLLSRPMPKDEQEVRIRLRNGNEHTHRVTRPKGDPTNPMTDEELLCKFRGNTKAFLTAECADNAVDLIKNLENVKTILELSEIVAKMESA